MTQRVAPEQPDLTRLLGGYRPKVGVADELFGADGAMRAVWRPLINHLARWTPEQAEENFGRGKSYLQDAGVYFRHYTNDPAPDRDWPLSSVPVLIHETEWATICDGLAQRAELLERVMADLYGPATLVRDGHLPAGLIARNPEWQRPLVGIRPASGRFLHVLSFEISRNPDGSWFVLGDRTQAPSGAGFALENRMATTRIFQDTLPRTNVHRLAGFFRAFRDALDNLPGSGNRRSAILTPGPGNASYFEHTFIARYLGLLLLEGEDMIVQDGVLKVRTVEGLEPLGTIWRRLDSGFADPLELLENSQLGTPGLVNALRLGNVNLINALGSGVLEMRALMAFLPKISQVLTGAPLKLPNIATWWCGQPAEREHVQQNADKMMIGGALDQDLPFDIGATTALGGKFRYSARASVDDWIRNEGDMLVGQEVVTLSTTPAWRNGRLAPRPMTVRVMAARTPAGWVFMPGGYARIGLSDDATALAMQRGGSVADVWVVSDTAVPKETLLDNGGLRTVRPEALPSRSAENLFWLGRYVERTEAAFRLVRAFHLRLSESGDPEDERLLQLAGFMDQIGIDPTRPLPPVLIQLLGWASNCAGKVRDRFSTDGWAALQDLAKTAGRMQDTVRPGDDAARAMSVLLRKITGFTGLVHENMYRFTGWQFLAFGRALERADATAAALIAFAAADAPMGAFDIMLELGDSVMSHRRRYHSGAKRETVLDLLALDPQNPRAILFQVNRMSGIARDLPQDQPEHRPSSVMRALLPLQSELTVAAPEDLSEEALVAVRTVLAQTSDLLSSVYLR